MRKFIYIILILILIINSSFSIVNNIDLEGFHLKVEDRKNVDKFYKKHKYIYENRAVYIAYLQKYYKNNEDSFINLIK